MKETTLKKKIHTDLKKIPKIWKFSPNQSGMGASGIPDIIACMPTTIKQEDVGKTFGLLVGIEAKVKGNTPTRLQLHQLEGIARAGGMALVITGEDRKPYTTKRIIAED